VRHTIQVRVRYADTDAAGIVHYAQFLAYLEAARADALRALGLVRESIVAFSLGTMVLDATLRYRSSARFDDLLDVAAWVTEVSATRFRWVYEIHRNSDRTLVLTAETEQCWSDGVGCSREASLPPWLDEALQRLGDVSPS
jgi:acyl-CoA thioester hydrolase